MLWMYLVHQEPVQDIFIRAVFGKRRSITLEEVPPNPEPSVPEPVRIIHKEQDSIAAFSLNQVHVMFRFFLFYFSALNLYSFFTCIIFFSFFPTLLFLSSCFFLNYYSFFLLYFFLLL